MNFASPPREAHWWLADDGQLFDDRGPVTQAVIYKFDPPRSEFVFDRTDKSEEMRAATRKWLSNDEHDVRIAYGQYGLPNPAAYSMAPGDEHPQVPVHVGNRFAFIDEGIAGLVRAAWLRGWDTFGSCQQRRAGEAHAGMAYVDFPIARQGREFDNIITTAGVPTTNHPSQFAMWVSQVQARVIVAKLTVLLNPADIARATTAILSAAR